MPFGNHQKIEKATSLAGIQRALGPLVSFLSPILCDKAKNRHKPHSERVPQAQCERQKKILFEITAKLFQKILILSLLSLDLYYIICYNISGKIFLAKYNLFRNDIREDRCLARRGNIHPNAASAHGISVCLFAFL